MPSTDERLNILLIMTDHTRIDPTNNRITIASPAVFDCSRANMIPAKGNVTMVIATSVAILDRPPAKGNKEKWRAWNKFPARHLKSR